MNVRPHFVVPDAAEAAAWGERQGQLTDPFGHRWNIAQHIRDLSPEEIAAAAAERFGG